MTKVINFTNINIQEFINYIITFDNINDILDNCKTQYDKGIIFKEYINIKKINL